ncbi:MAG: Holliday junction resolvase RuvX [Actinomycetaceae bacterium]|nr:Holliday junction resolvase RuvX [Actinomycetaceae bacterium]
MIGVDVGKARVGVARCDDDAIMALPVATLRRDRWGGDVEEVAELVESLGAHRVVVGLPRLMGGSAGAAVEDAVAWARELDELVDVPIRLLDERLTSVSAHAQLREAGRPTRTHRSIIDQQAAVIIVEHALESERRTGHEAGISLDEWPTKEEE